MPVFEDWLNNPLSIVNNIFASDPTNFDQKVTEYFEAKLKTEKNYYSIPCINEVPIHELKPNCLVRYRCMIQDSFDPIYFSSTHKLRNLNTNETIQITFKYKEHLDIPNGFVDPNEDEINQEVTLQSTSTLEEAMDCHFSNKGQNNLQQRMTFYCVPIPGESEWVKNVYKSNSTVSSVNLVGSSSNTSHRPSKRGIDSENGEEIIADSCLSEVTNNTNTETKTINENISLNSQYRPFLNESNVNSLAKKTKTEDCENSKQNTKKNENYLNFPLTTSNESGHPCLVKVYDNFDNYKINDLVEFIGILSHDPSLAYEHDEHGDSLHHHNFEMSERLMSTVSLEENLTEMSVESSNETSRDNDADKKRHNLQVLSSFPPSLVPRLHCIFSHSLMHNNPFLAKEKTVCGGSKTDIAKEAFWQSQKELFLSGTSESNEIINLRQEILACFQEMLLGDALAAEYLLMHLLSTVFLRKDITVLGKMSLNLTGVPLPVMRSFNDENKETAVSMSFADSFFKVLSQFVTMSHMYPLTIENLNKSNLIPCKDYDKNKLITGMLQLPQNFQLVIDETTLNPGELSAKGLMNFNAIKEIIQSQKLNYDFNYHLQEFPTNIRVLTLSETKSILPSDCVLKLNPTVERFDAATYENIMFNLLGQKDSNLLNNFRNYLTVLSNLEYKIPDHVQKIVEDDIVNVRKDFVSSSSNKNKNIDKSKTVDIDGIHLILIVARLQALSYGHSELTLNEWNTAKTLEFERLHNRV